MCSLMDNRMSYFPDFLREPLTQESQELWNLSPGIHKLIVNGKFVINLYNNFYKTFNWIFHKIQLFLFLWKLCRTTFVQVTLLKRFLENLWKLRFPLDQLIHKVEKFILSWHWQCSLDTCWNRSVLGANVLTWVEWLYCITFSKSFCIAAYLESFIPEPLLLILPFFFIATR